MNSLPGGKLAPPPPVSRVAAGGAAFLVAVAFGFLWAGIWSLYELGEHEPATTILRKELEGPTTQALREALARRSTTSPIEVHEDLVRFSIDRAAARDINAPVELARARAEELYREGFPRVIRGVPRTETGLPRSFLSLLTEPRHKQLSRAVAAGMIGLGASLLLCAGIATGAARFALPGSAALVGFGVVVYHLRLFDLWVKDQPPAGSLYSNLVRQAAIDPQRRLLFVGLALVISGFIYSALLGATKAVAQERRRKRRRSSGKRREPTSPAEAAEPEASA